MNLKNSLVSGTIILTLSGLLSRVIGFFYRIFLSQHFGEEAMGIYQLIGPVMGLSYALCISGIQSAIAKQIAEKASKKVLYIGMCISLSVSVLCMSFLVNKADYLAGNILYEPRLAPLITVLAYSLPLACIHSCINGYFYGKKQAKYPAILQLLEQLARVLAVIIIFTINDAKGVETPLYITIMGVLVGEVVSSLFSILFYRLEKKKKYPVKNTSTLSIVLEIFRYSIPLTTTRIVVGLLQSVENIYIPQNLLLAGYNTPEALSLFGVLTGMALPLIMFPTAITNSLSSMLLPAVSEQNAEKTPDELSGMLKKSISFCMLLGFLCFLCFFILGKFLGNFLFHSSLAGTFIMCLSFICPFMYTNTSLGAIINGLGKTGFTFFTHIISTLIRLFFVFYMIPKFGILGYLWGVLLSQLFSFLISFIYINKRFDLFHFNKHH